MSEKQRRTILLVDDDPLARRATRRLLQQCYEVLTADSYASALGVLETHQEVRAIVSDCRMGSGPGGAELLERVQSAYPHVGRVTLSGIEESALEQLVARGVAHAALPRTCKQEELLAALAPHCAEPAASRQERRRAPRMPMAGVVWYQPIRPPARATVAGGIARAVDLSESGIGLIATRSLVAETVLLAISRPKLQLRAAAQVVHSAPFAPSYHRLGLSFLAIPPADTINLRQLLARDA